MQTNENYTFDVSLSLESFRDKTISNAMIGGTDKEEVRNIRQAYGFNPWSGISFKQTTLTSQFLLDTILKGKVFCNLFNPKQYKADGSFGSHQKSNDNFAGSYLLCVDIDRTRYGLDEYISKLTYKPTIYHTTPSHLKYTDDGEFLGPRFRLLYVFDEKIENPLYFRYCADKLYGVIESDTGEPVYDRCGLNCSQYFNGSYIGNPDTTVCYGISHNVYNLRDLHVSLSDYRDYLTGCAGYESLSDKKEKQIVSELERITGDRYYYHWPTHSFGTHAPVYSYENEVQYELKSSELSQSTVNLLYDWDRLDLEEFMSLPEWKKAYHTTKYVYRVEKEWIDNLYQYVDDDYFALFYITETIKDGGKRRKNLFERMCLRRYMKPEITKDELVINTIRDIIKFFDNNDGMLGMDFIRSNVDAAFNLTIERIGEIYSKTIALLKAYTRPKRGIIYFNKKARSRETTFSILDELYDNNLSVLQNLDYINECMDFKISKSVLYAYVKDRGIKTDSYKLDDDELMDLLDVNLSVKKNMETLRDNGIKGSNNRINRLLNKKRSMVYPKEPILAA